MIWKIIIKKSVTVIHLEFKRNYITLCYELYMREVTPPPLCQFQILFTLSFPGINVLLLGGEFSNWPILILDVSNLHKNVALSLLNRFQKLLTLNFLNKMIYTWRYIILLKIKNAIRYYINTITIIVLYIIFYTTIHSKPTVKT